MELILVTNVHNGMGTAVMGMIDQHGGNALMGTMGTHDGHDGRAHLNIFDGDKDAGDNMTSRSTHDGHTS